MMFSSTVRAAHLRLRVRQHERYRFSNKFFVLLCSKQCKSSSNSKSCNDHISKGKVSNDVNSNIDSLNSSKTLYANDANQHNALHKSLQKKEEQLQELEAESCHTTNSEHKMQQTDKEVQKSSEFDATTLQIQFTHKLTKLQQEQEQEEWSDEKLQREMEHEKQKKEEHEQEDANRSNEFFVKKHPYHHYHQMKSVNSVYNLSSHNEMKDEMESVAKLKPSHHHHHSALPRTKLTFDMLSNEPPQSKFSFLAHPDEVDTPKFIVHDIVPNNTPKPLLPMWASSLTSPTLGKVQLDQHNWVSSDSFGVIDNKELIDNFVQWIKSCVPAESTLPQELDENVIFHLRRSCCRGLYARHAFSKGDVIMTIPLTVTVEVENIHIDAKEEEHQELTKEKHILAHSSCNSNVVGDSVNNNNNNDDDSINNSITTTTTTNNSFAPEITASLLHNKNTNKSVLREYEKHDNDNNTTIKANKDTEINQPIDNSMSDSRESASNSIQQNDSTRQSIVKYSNNMLVNTETLASEWHEQKKLNEFTCEEHHCYTLEHVECNKECDNNVATQRKCFLPSYKFIFDLLMEHDAMTGNMESNLVPMLNRTIHPLFIEQIYLAMQLACERSAQRASRLYPYLALLEYAEVNNIHHYTNDEEIMRLHNDVIELTQLREYDEEAKL